MHTDTVAHAVVHLEQHRAAAAIPLDQMELPQRPVALQARVDAVRHQLLQLLVLGVQLLAAELVTALSMANTELVDKGN
jgi:hypothetical protein